METWKRKLRMGMVGGGQGAFIGAVHRIAAALDQQIELVAGCFSRDYENTMTTGRQLYLESSRCYETYEEMARKEAALSEDERIDFAAIVTPNNSHFAIARAFLNNGFHVVCDKPITFSLEEARELVEIVRESGLIFALTHNYTGNPLVREARELFTSGKLGKVRKVMVEYLQDFLMYPHEKEGMKQAVWRVDPKQSGLGGALGDVGSHALNLLEFITGEEVSELCADKSTFLPDRELDEDANILVRLSGGGKGTVCVSQIATGEENALRIRIYASEGGISWDQEEPNYMKVWKYNEPKHIYTRSSGYLGSEAAHASRIPAGHPEGYLEAFANIYCGVVEAIRAHIDGAPLQVKDYRFPTVYDGLRGMLFITRAVESSDEGSIWKNME